MLSNKMVAKVFLTTNNELHIITHFNQIVPATVLNLLLLFSNPQSFITSKVKSYKSSNYQIGVKSPCIDDIYGVTLVTIKDDNSIEIVHPFIFDIMLKRLVNPPNYSLKYEPSEDFEAMDESQKLINLINPSASHNFKTIPFIRCYSHNPDKSAQILFEISKAYENTSVQKEDIEQIDLLPPNDISRLKIALADTTIPDVFGNSEEDYLTLKEYSKKHQYKINTVRGYCYQGKFKSAKINNDGIWVIHKDDVPFLKSKRSRPMPSGDAWKATRKNENASYDEVQKYIIYNDYFTEKTRGYIRTMPELNYYLSNQYLETYFNGRPMLLIDINPEYIVKGDNRYSGKTNRELIKLGLSPVVPGSENGEGLEHYELHHVGQSANPDSPFAIVPADDHRKKHYNIFHDGSSGENLHDALFEIEKKSFWQTYICEYDKYKRFEDFPHKNTIITRKRILYELQKKIGTEKPKAS